MPCFKFYLSCREMFQKFLTTIKKFNLHKIVKFSDSNFNTCWMHCIFFFCYIVYITISIIYFDRNQWHLRSSGFIKHLVHRHAFDIRYIFICVCCLVWCFQMSFALLGFRANITCVFNTRPSKSSNFVWASMGGGMGFLSFVTFYLFCKKKKSWRENK